MPTLKKPTIENWILASVVTMLLPTLAIVYMFSGGYAGTSYIWLFIGIPVVGLAYLGGIFAILNILRAIRYLQKGDTTDKNEWVYGGIVLPLASIAYLVGFWWFNISYTFLHLVW